MNWFRQNAFWVWMLFIFTLTSVPGNDLPEVQINYLDKVVHFCLYFLLAYFLLLRFYSRDNLYRLTGIILAGLAFAFIDELHQKWIPGRFSSLGDFLADGLGVIAAVILFVLVWRRAKGRQTKKSWVSFPGEKQI